MDDAGKVRRMRRTQAGLTLTEMLVSLLMTIIIAGALFNAFVNTFAMKDEITNTGDLATASRTAIDQMADHIRDAQQFWNNGGATPTSVSQSSVIAAASASSITYYKSNNSTDTVRYWLSGTNLQRTADGTTKTVLANVQSLVLTYYKIPAGTYNVDYNDSTKYVSVGSSPAGADLPYLGGVDISATVLVSGTARNLISRVRLRNSPYKLHL